MLGEGTVRTVSAAILDWLDETVGPERALIPRAGAERRRALRLIALATGAVDKAGAAAYERIIRPAQYRWPGWIVRCRTQAEGAIAALANRSEEHTSELQSLMRISYAVFCLQKEIHNH